MTDKAADQQRRRRRDTWQQAGLALQASGLQLTVTASITWAACLAADQMEGHILGLGERERVNRVWDRLRRVCRDHGEERWIAARAPEYDRHKGLHLHVAFRAPTTAYRDLIRVLERLTGAPLEGAITPDGRTVKRPGRVIHGVIAIGQCGAWLLQRNMRLETGGTEGIMRYVTKSVRASETKAQYRLSNGVVGVMRAHVGKVGPEKASQARAEAHSRPLRRAG